MTSTLLARFVDELGMHGTTSVVADPVDPQGTTKAVKEKTKKVKETVELEMRFSDEQRQRPAGRGGRGGRGGAAPSRGGARGGRSNGPAPALEDTNAFPSLTKA